MKKKISIVISLAFLLFTLNSCEQEDQISSFQSVDHSISVDKNSMLPLQTESITKEDVEEESCGDPIGVTLFAGQHIDVGTISISNSGTKLFVTYDVTGSNWWLSETHLFAGDIDDAPFTNIGNPQIGQFDYHGPDELTQYYIQCISLDEIDEVISIIAHAVVVQKQDGQTSATETAFGKGDTEFSGNRWGWIIDYEPQDCDDDDDDDETSEDEETLEDEEIVDQDISDDQEDTDRNNLDDTNNQGCMDAFAYSSPGSSQCTTNDFDRWGWTNNVIPNDRHYIPGGVTYTYPLYASAFDCAIDNSIKIGDVQIKVEGGDSVLYATVSVTLTKQELSITEIDIYAGETSYPIDDSGNPTMVFDEFDVSLNSMNEKSYTVTWLDWYDQTNFIVHVKVCPEEILP